MNPCDGIACEPETVKSALDKGVIHERQQHLRSESAAGRSRSAATSRSQGRQGLCEHPGQREQESYASSSRNRDHSGTNRNRSGLHGSLCTGQGQRVSLAPLQANEGAWPNEYATARTRNTAEGMDFQAYSQGPSSIPESDDQEPDIVVREYSTFTISA